MRFPHVATVTLCDFGGFFGFLIYSSPAHLLLISYSSSTHHRPSTLQLISYQKLKHQHQHQHQHQHRSISHSSSLHCHPIPFHCPSIYPSHPALQLAQYENPFFVCLFRPRLHGCQPHQSPRRTPPIPCTMAFLLTCSGPLRSSPWLMVLSILPVRSLVDRGLVTGPALSPSHRAS